MSLYTKSIQKPVKSSDGVRICIMRKPGLEAKWDIWIPHLSPSEKVLSARHAGTMTFNEHKVWFAKHVLKEKGEYVRILAEMASKRDVTILCWEKDHRQCHRSWVADECVRINFNLKVIHR